MKIAENLDSMFKKTNTKKNRRVASMSEVKDYIYPKTHNTMMSSISKHKRKEFELLMNYRDEDGGIKSKDAYFTPKDKNTKEFVKENVK